MYKDVGLFHNKFALPHAQDGRTGPVLLDDNSMLFRLAFLMEEIVELQQAHQRGDLPNVADSLVDLVYIALGTAHLMNLPWEELWDEVQRANMAKERGPTAKRGHSLDVRKPEGWQPPDIAGVLRASGWEEDQA